MVRQRVQKSSERSSQPQESAMAPVLTQRHSPSPQTQQDTKSQVIQQHNREATVLKIQAKHGTITPQGQERLTFLQAKMADETQRKLNFGDRVHQNSLNSSGGDVSVAPPERNTASPIQAKLTIGQPGDKYEQEADRVASEVVQRINTPSSTEESVQCEAMPEEELQLKSLADSIQRAEIDDKAELRMKTQVQRRAAIDRREASEDLETAINSAKGGGQSLEAGLQQSMGQAMGADFSRVRVHTDARSDRLNQSIQARAFTTGQDVFFGQGEYNPGSRGGQELIAHELTHVVQQGADQVRQKSQGRKVEQGEVDGQKSVEKAKGLGKMQGQEKKVQRCKGIETEQGWRTVSSLDENIELDKIDESGNIVGDGGALTVFLVGTGVFQHRVVALEWYDGIEKTGKELAVHLTTPELAGMGNMRRFLNMVGSVAANDSDARMPNTMDTLVERWEWNTESIKNKQRRTVRIDEGRKQQVFNNLDGQIGQSSGGYSLWSNSCKTWAGQVAPEALI